ncbi:MAG: hypothetical protein H7A24_12350 [Leptospiraceae bacterium]|nr:hypothetical protein [Leptospiraceae bacterium]MCP5512666.1 hypothetical protein [Leptospiraceae bacterium]
MFAEMNQSMVYFTRGTKNLNGTGYIELLPGKFDGKFWNENSLFIDHDIFNWIEPFIIKYFPAFEPYDFRIIESEIWSNISQDIEETIQTLNNGGDRESLGFAFRSIKNFQSEYFIQILTEFNSWLKPVISEYRSISLLGL